ncbi:MAG TPA: NmrA family NAD(P)-binding protein [Polyangiaceae bacterium]|nr:NmrA family NAD(P)-binding protein [Polyangiaceae bacterium]
MATDHDTSKSSERSGQPVILVTGGTGHLGTQVLRLLGKRGEKLRVLTRDRARGAQLTEAGLTEVVLGDAIRRDDAAA